MKKVLDILDDWFPDVLIGAVLVVLLMVALIITLGAFVIAEFTGQGWVVYAYLGAVWMVFTHWVRKYK